jgi:hypothetical protein
MVVLLVQGMDQITSMQIAGGLACNNVERIGLVKKL